MAREVRLLGVRVHDVTQDEALDIIEGSISSGRPHQVVTVNPEFLVMAQEDEGFKAVLNGADLALPDGVGLLWASRLLGRPLKERVAGVDMVALLSQRAAARGYGVYFLGAREGVAQEAARDLQIRFPGLRVAGAYAGSPSPEEEDDLVRRVREASPQVLFVAYGAPGQDRWIQRNLARLEVPVCMGVGGAFDFLSGRARRAPSWARRLGVEWLFRLWQEPWRWRRMLRLPYFALLVLRERLWKKR